MVYADGASYPADLLILATGVNSPAPLDPVFDYRPPETEAMAQEEIARPAHWPEEKVAGFFGGMPGLVFAALVPKGPYLNVSLFYKGEAADPVRSFYQTQSEALLRFFPRLPESLCRCRPRIVVGPARVYYGDRWVAIGDAAVSRLYKDGINSAFMSSRVAMHTALEHGVGRADFERGYAPCCRRMAADNRYGELLFGTSARVMRNRFFARAYINGVRAEAGLPEREAHPLAPPVGYVDGRRILPRSVRPPAEAAGHRQAGPRAGTQVTKG